MPDTISPYRTTEMRRYILEHGDDLSFTRFFWKGCEPLESDIIQYHKFANAHALVEKRSDRFWISEELEVSKGTVRNWLLFEKMPKLAHYLLAYLSLGVPSQDRSWLTLRCTHGHAIPLGPWVRVPSKVTCWSEVKEVVDQITPLESTTYDRYYCLGFFLGMMLGDANKSKQGHAHRHVNLVLSMEYDTNLRIGDFICVCASALGLKMNRDPDLQKPVGKPNGFFSWSSESSPLVDWMFNACLGLEDNELTTYDAVKMDWAFVGPDTFRRGLLQGMAESDGSVNVPSQTVEIWIDPSRDFVGKLLETFGVRSFRSREALAITKTQVKKAFEIPLFSPDLQTKRYELFRKLAEADHIGHGKRLPPEMRRFIQEASTQGLSTPAIASAFLDKYGLSLSYETVQRWAAKPMPKSRE